MTWVVIGFCAVASAVARAGVIHKVQCEWYDEQVVVISAKVGGDDRKALDKLLKALLDSLGDAAPEISALTQAIDKLGLGGDVVDVVIIYACEDDEGHIHRKKYQCDDTENVLWAAKMNLATGAAAKERDDQRAVIIKKHKPPGRCCTGKVKNTSGSTTPDSTKPANSTTPATPAPQPKLPPATPKKSWVHSTTNCR